MFDPYHKWLGIAKDEQPPTYYRLLGIRANEQDPEVIEEAAIRQTTHLRTYQIGQHAEQCTRLLNEIAQARSTLIDAAKRKAYDASLTKRQQPEAKSAPTELITATRFAPPKQSCGARKLMLTCIVGGTALIGIGLVLWLFGGRPPADKKPPIADGTKKVTGAGVAKKKVQPKLAARPVARWVFDNSLRDTIGRLHGHAAGDPKFLGDKLRLGPSDTVTTDELASDLAERTLEVWLNLPVSNQKSADVMKVEQAGVWDGIKFSDFMPGRWTPGSDFRRRSHEFGEMPLETSGPADVLQLAAVYAHDNSITLYRNGQLLAGPFTPQGPCANLQNYEKGKAVVTFGGGIVCDLIEARLYNRALAGQEIAVSYQEMAR